MAKEAKTEAAAEAEAKTEAKASVKVPAGFVRVRIPDRYAKVAVRGPNGKTTTALGGEIAVLPEKQARDIGAKPDE